MARLPPLLASWLVSASKNVSLRKMFDHNGQKIPHRSLQTLLCMEVRPDARRFMLRHRSILETAPLQIYIAALLFSPRESVIRQIFVDEIPHWIRILGVSEERWSACLQTLEGHRDSVEAVTFSPDGKKVASGSDDCTIRLWDTATGTALHTLGGHQGSVSVVAFSPDGKTVAPGSHDNTVRLWDAATGAALHRLEGRLIQQLDFSGEVPCLKTDRGLQYIQCDSANLFTPKLQPLSSLFVRELPYFLNKGFAWDSMFNRLLKCWPLFELIVDCRFACRFAGRFAFISLIFCVPTSPD